MSSGMLRYAGSRLLQAVPLLLGIVTLTFVLLHLAPGDPTQALANPNIPPEVFERMRVNWGLDRPLHEQYLLWIAAFFRGDFGFSYFHRVPVTEVIGATLPNTILLGAVSMLVTFVVGCLIGTVQAVRQYGWADNVLTVLALAIYSMPGFWLALMMIIAVSLWWPDGPIAVSGMSSIYGEASLRERLADLAGHMALPVISLGLASAAGVSRYMRGEMLEVVQQDYIRTARAKGLHERAVIYKHALRNALIPVVSLLGLYLPVLIGGSVVIEVVFSWPGMGNELYQAVLRRDYPVVLAGTFLFSLLVVIGNLLADLLYALVDPRIRHG